VEEVMDGIRRCLLRMADLYSIDEDYDKAIEYFQKTIDFESQRDGFESSRLVASVYFQKATCYNNQNGANCEIAAIN
jgi:tetratricopeptide (TPR) repeat protein